MTQPGLHRADPPTLVEGVIPSFMNTVVTCLLTALGRRATRSDMAPLFDGLGLRGLCLRPRLPGSRAWKSVRVRPLAALWAAVVPTARPGFLTTCSGLLFGVCAVVVGFSDEDADGGGVLAQQMMVLVVTEGGEVDSLGAGAVLARCWRR